MLINNNEYFEVLDNIKTRIKTAQYKAVLGANRELMELYWNIGKIILANTKYGAKFVENLSKDILAEFPDIKGFSVRNLKYMRKFAEIYPDFQKVQQGVALLPWRNNLTLLSKVNKAIEMPSMMPNRIICVDLCHYLVERKNELGSWYVSHGRNLNGEINCAYKCDDLESALNSI